MSAVTSPLAELTLTAPLFTAWRPQYVKLRVPELLPGAPARLLLDGAETPFQYTGCCVEGAAEVLVRLGFAQGQQRTLTFFPGDTSATTLTPQPIPLSDAVTIGPASHALTLNPLRHADGTLGGPLGAFAGYPLTSRVASALAVQAITLARTNDGPLYTEYILTYHFPENAHYTLTYTFYLDEPLLEVAESFLLGMDAHLTVELNPADVFTHLVSHSSFDFQAGNEPIVESLGIARPKDVLCRLQMPPLGEFTVPNNRGWFAFFNDADHARGMLGLVGLYGERWRRPVDNIMQVHDRGDGRATLTAALADGERHWLLVAGPVETCIPADHHYLFNRLYSEFNQLRLDEHLDLTGAAAFDDSCRTAPGFFETDWEAIAQENLRVPPLAAAVPGDDSLLAAMGLTAADATAARAALRDALFERFERWVWQFQGYRNNDNDYDKCVIGFSRTLRTLMLHYEFLTKVGFLTDEEIRRCGAYFAFAARRIMDEGRWPHSKTALHPWHPDSTRRMYYYPGEHEPDKLYWTNCLPNFQSDPLTALIHLAALLPDHPDARRWLRKGMDDLEGQLDAYCGQSGAWEESINYALFTMFYFVITFRILKNRWGIDYFHDDRVRRYVRWLTRFYMGIDKRFDAGTWPPIGNSRLPQNGCVVLLLFASELAEDDPLRAACLAVSTEMLPNVHMAAYEVPFLLSRLLPDLTRAYPMPALSSEAMDEVGVALRHGHPSPTHSYLFQKIGMAKDHYEGDESSFNWVAKGTPLCMDYGTYTGDAGGWQAHNLVEIPDEDPLRRGYLAETFFSNAVDYTRAEMPVVLKLSYGRVRTFAEIDGPPQKPLFFYIGDENPVGPRAWKRRLLLFVKPDYVLLYDRVFAAVPHRFNLHVTADAITPHRQEIRCTGRFDLDLLCFVQHPAEFRLEKGELIPAPSIFGEGDANPQRQHFFRLYNDTDGVYRTVLFAQERGRDVHIEPCGSAGVKIVTPEYTDYAFASDELVEIAEDGVRFNGRVGWIRRTGDGTIRAALPDGDMIEAFGRSFDGVGPWAYNTDWRQTLDVRGTPRRVVVR